MLETSAYQNLLWWLPVIYPYQLHRDNPPSVSLVHWCNTTVILETITYCIQISPISFALGNFQQICLLYILISSTAIGWTCWLSWWRGRRGGWKWNDQPCKKSAIKCFLALAQKPRGCRFHVTGAPSRKEDLDICMHDNITWHRDTETLWHRDMPRAWQ